MGEGGFFRAIGEIIHGSMMSMPRAYKALLKPHFTLNIDNTYYNTY